MAQGTILYLLNYHIHLEFNRRTVLSLLNCQIDATYIQRHYTVPPELSDTLGLPRFSLNRTSWMPDLGYYEKDYTVPPEVLDGFELLQ